MKILYIVNTRHDPEAYRVYAKVHMEGRATPMTKAISAIIGLLITAGGVLAVARQGPKVLYLITIVVGVLCVFSQPLGLWRMRRRLVKNAQDIQMNIDYRFGEESFTVTYPGQTEQVAYGDLKRIVETPGYFFVYTDIRMAHILPKAHFTQGDAAGFGAFLTEKSGLPVVQMNV